MSPSASVSLTLSRQALGSRCPGAPALTWAPVRSQPRSTSHRRRRAMLPARPCRDEPEREAGTLCRSLERLPTRNLAGAGQTCGRERGAAGAARSAYRISFLRAKARALGLPGKAALQGPRGRRGPAAPRITARPAWLQEGRGSARAPAQSHCVPQPRGPEGNGSRAPLPPPPARAVSTSVHSVPGSNPLSLGAPCALSEWSESSPLSSRALTTSHGRPWIVWLKASEARRALRLRLCAEQSPQPSQVLRLPPLQNR